MLSAGSSAVEARDPRTQAIMMLRGKVINALRSSEERVLKNQEYHDIIQAIGAGFGKNFDVRKMNFDKIVITSDADVDGFNIAQLLLVFFWTYMRPLVTEGKLYRAETPLFVGVYKNKEYYFYTAAELDDFMKDKKASDVKISRNKGLGELNAEDLKRVCFDVKNYHRIVVSDVAKAGALIQDLMGDDVDKRKNFLYNNVVFEEGK